MRDFKAEYQRRIAKGLAKGLSRQQARGHRQKTLRGRPNYDRILERGVKRMRDGIPLSSAAAELHVSTERLRNYVQGSGIAKKRKGRWHIAEDNRIRVMPLASSGQLKKIKLEGYEPARHVGQFMSAAGLFLRSHDLTLLDPFIGGLVIDVQGKSHFFETDPNTLHSLLRAGDEPFQVYQILN